MCTSILQSHYNVANAKSCLNAIIQSIAYKHTIVIHSVQKAANHKQMHDQMAMKQNVNGNLRNAQRCLTVQTLSKIWSVHMTRRYFDSSV